MSRLQRIHTWGSTGLLILLMALSGLTAFGCASGVGDGVQNPDQIVGVGVKHFPWDAAQAPAAGPWSAPQGFPSSPSLGVVVGYELYRAASPRAAAVPEPDRSGWRRHQLHRPADEPEPEPADRHPERDLWYVAVNRAATGPASDLRNDSSPVIAEPLLGDLYTCTVRCPEAAASPFRHRRKPDLGSELVSPGSSAQATVLSRPS